MLEVPISLSVPARCLFPGPYPAHSPGPSRKLFPPHHAAIGNEWPEVDWGMVNTVRLVTINSLGVEFEHLDIELAARLDRELNVWATRLYGWISVLMKGPTGYMFALGRVSWQPDFQDELLPEAYSDGKLYEPQALTEWQWRHALEHVATGDLPPTNRMLLATAMTHASNESYRSAVLDSATAAELTLVNAISKWVRDHGGEDNLVGLLLKGKTLGGLIGLAKNLSIPVPADAIKNLVEPRNRVMHGGHVATSENASAAIRVAQAIVSKLDPFPFHCDEEARALVSMEDWEEFTNDS